MQLEEPHGWFLLKAAHQHTAIIYRGDTHQPIGHHEGDWYVQFQRYPDGGRATDARGHTLEEAWNNATQACLAVDLKLMGVTGG